MGKNIFKPLLCFIILFFIFSCSRVDTDYPELLEPVFDYGFSNPRLVEGELLVYIKNIRVLDCIRYRTPPFSPEAVVKEFSEVIKSYGLSTVTGDRYAGEWPREQFLKCGVHYKTAEKPKSAIYGELLPLINSGKAELLDNELLTRQLLILERRTSRAG